MINWFTIFAVMSQAQQGSTSKDRQSAEILQRLSKEATEFKSKRSERLAGKNRAEFVNDIIQVDSSSSDDKSPSK